jgi:hypothetical protein
MAVSSPPFEHDFEDTEEYVDDADELDAGAQPYQPTQAKPGAGTPPDFKRLDESTLRALLESGQHYYPTASELARRWVQQSVSADQIEDNLRALFDAVPAPQQDKKWRKRRAGRRCRSPQESSRRRPAAELDQAGSVAGRGRRR